MSEHTQTEWPVDWPISACEWADQREETIEKLHGDIDRLRTRLYKYERDLFDERTGENRSQDTEWLRRGFLQRGAEIERLEEGIQALAQTIEAESDRHQQSWRNGASLHYEGRADQAADDADRLCTLLQE